MCPPIRTACHSHLVSFPSNPPVEPYITLHFGSLAWHHVPKERRRKLDAKSEGGIVVGSLENRQYKTWIPSRNIAVISRDVRIVEDKFPGAEISDDLPQNEAILVDDSETNHKSLPNNSQLQRTPVQSSNNEESSNSPFNNIQEAEKTVAGQRQDAEYLKPPTREQLDQLTHYPDPSNVETDVTNISPKAEPVVVREVDETIQDLHKPRYPSRERRETSYYTPGSASSARGFTVMGEKLQDPSSVREAMAQGDAAEWKSQSRQSWIPLYSMEHGML